MKGPCWMTILFQTDKIIYDSFLNMLSILNFSVATILLAGGDIARVTDDDFGRETLQNYSTIFYCILLHLAHLFQFGEEIFRF